MKKIKSIFYFCIIIISLFLLTGCSEQKTEEELLKDKILSELEFFESETFLIIEKYLNEDYIVDNNLDWEEIRDDFENISNSSSVIILDLISAKVNDDEILKLESRINAVNSVIENKDENSFLESLKNFYNLIPIYLKEIYPDNKNIYLEKDVNSNLLESLYYCITGNYEQSLNYIESAESIYKELINDTDFIEDNSYNMNRVYILIQEMKQSIQNQEKENVIIKFLNII